jgi:hypothetical protein
MTIDLLCRTFYEELVDAAKLQTALGGIYEYPVLYPPAKLFELAPVSIEPQQNNYRFRIVTYSGASVRQYPIYELGLRLKDHFFAIAGKRRPVIILAYCSTIQVPGSSLQAPNYNILLVAPCLTFKARHSQTWIDECKALRIINTFYLPQSNNGFRLSHEGYVDFNYVQPAVSTYITNYRCITTGNNIKLSFEGYNLLMTHLLNYMGSRYADPILSGDIKAYGDALFGT